ncbi:MAG: cyclic nucleotide-binding domain-containing protein [Blastococcus sp.]
MVSADDLAGFPVFGQLTAGQRDSVAGVARECNYADGAGLFREGNPAAGCWVLRSGQVALGAAVPGRGQVVMQTLHARDVVGWSWLVPPYRWPFTATAVGPVAAIDLDARRLRVLTGRDPTLCCGLLLGLFAGVLGQLQSTQARLLDLYGSPRER